MPIDLDLDQLYFTAWHVFFCLLRRQYGGLIDHIDGITDARAKLVDTEWSVIEFVIHHQLYMAISYAIHIMIIREDNSTYTAWTAVVSRFHDNRL